MIFIEGSLLSTDDNQTRFSDTNAEEDELSLTLENFIVFGWFMFIHPDLLRPVKQRYVTELRSRALASIQPKTSQSIPLLFSELRKEDA